MSIQSSLPAASAAAQLVAQHTTATNPAQRAAIGAGAPGEVKETNASTTATQTAGNEAVPREVIDQAVEKVSEALKTVARSLHFSIDEDTGQTVIRITDSATKEVIRQMPSKEFLEISKAMEKLQGLFITQEA